MKFMAKESKEINRKRTAKGKSKNAVVKRAHTESSKLVQASEIVSEEAAMLQPA